MADVDTSIYGRITPPANPLQMLPAAEQVNRLSLFPLVQQQQEAATKGAQLDLAVRGLDVARQGIASLAGNPNLSKRDVIDYLTTLSRQPGMETVPTSQFVSEVNGLPNDRKSLMGWVTRHQAAAIGPAGGAAERTIGVTPEGQPIVGTVAQGLRRAQGLDQPEPAPAPVAPAPAAPAPAAPRAAPPLPQGVVSTMPAGYGEAASAVGGASGQASNALRAAADTSMTRKGMLGNLEEDLQHFIAGPGADWQKITKAWVNRNVPLPAGWQFDPKSIASQEAFNKQATMLAQQQFATIGGTGTDAKFSSAFETNPNDTLSHLGNQNIIRLLKGNEDAIQAKQKAWLAWRKQFGPQSYDEFSQDFNTRFDPRAFQFKYLSPRERQDYIDRMDPRDRDQFLSNLAAAHKAGWVTFPTR